MEGQYYNSEFQGVYIDEQIANMPILGNKLEELSINSDKNNDSISIKSEYVASDFNDFYFNGGTLKLQAFDGSYKAFFIYAKKGLTYKWNLYEAQSIVVYDRLPVVNGGGYVSQIYSNSYTPIYDCYIVFTVSVNKISTDGYVFTVEGGLIDNLNEIKGIAAENTKSSEFTIAEITDIKKSLSVYEEIDLSNSKKGIYIFNGNSEDFLPLSNYDSVQVDVKEGDVISYGVALGGESAAAIVMYDVQGNNRGWKDKGTGVYETEITKGYLLIPEGVTKISFTTYNPTPGAYLKKGTGYKDVSDITKGFEMFKEEFLQKKSPNIWKGEVVDGVIGTTGAFTSIPSWRLNKSTDYIEVKPNTYYYLSGRNGDIRSIRCINNSDYTKKVLAAATGAEGTGDSVYFYLPDVTGSYPVLNGQFKTPSDAKYVQISLAGDTGNWDRFMLEEVGPEYVEDFKPSPYQPYSDEMVIAKDKLPYTEEDDSPESELTGRKLALKVLLIGSSHGMNTIAQFPWIAYKSGFDITVGNVYKGSLTLQQIAESIQADTAIGGWYKKFKDGYWSVENSTKLDSVVKDEEWDFIILQRSASDDETWTDSQSQAMDIIIEKIKSSCNNVPTILFNSGLADPIQSTMIQASTNIINTALEMKKEYQIEVIPTATAVQNARNTKLASLGNYEWNYLCYDSQHLDYGIGCYVASATVFEFIMRKFGYSVLCAKGYGTADELRTFVGSVIDTGGDVDSNNAYTEPTEETMKIAKYCAIAAVNDVNTFSIKLAEKYSK